MGLNEIVGHSRQISIIKRLIEHNTLPASMAFTGAEGVGKKLTALETLKEVIKNPLEIKIIGEEKSPSVEEVREATAWLFQKPSASQKKGLIVDRSDEMRSEAANALLKTLEEPPTYAHIILIATNEHALLPTIRSRCRILRFGKLNQTAVEHILSLRGIPADQKLIKLAGGSPGLAIKLSQSRVPELIQQLSELLRKEPKLLTLTNFSREFSKLPREEALLFLTALENLLFQKDTIFRWFNAIKKARQYLKFHGKPQSVIEWLLIEVVYNQQ